MILLSFVALAAWSADIAAEQSPQPFPGVFVERGFLAGRSWKGDEEIDLATRNWPAYTDKQGFDDKTVLRKATVSVLGQPFTAEYRVFKADATQEVIFVGDKYDEGFCSALFKWAVRNLGKPSKMLERSISKPGQMWTETWSEKEADWAVGVGRVRIECSGFKIADSYVPALSILVYRHQAHLKPLEDLVSEASALH